MLANPVEDVGKAEFVVLHSAANRCAARPGVPITRS